MVAFRPAKTVATAESAVTVDGDLKPGIYRFQLVVENERGLSSVPDLVSVTIRERLSPTPEPLRPPSPFAGPVRPSPTPGPLRPSPTGPSPFRPPSPTPGPAPFRPR